MAIVNAGVAEIPRIVRQLEGLVEMDLKGSSDSLTPHLLIHLYDTAEAKASDAMVLLYVPFNEHEEKHRTMRDVAARFHREKKFPLAIAFASEAWRSARVSPDGPYKMPADDPEREEIIVLNALTITAKAVHQSLLVRRENGKLLRAGEWERAPEGAKIRNHLLESFFQGLYQSIGRSIAARTN